jgi:hypothetical protein
MERENTTAAVERYLDEWPTSSGDSSWICSSRFES